jgi:dienelactone hydrolase
MEKYGIVLLFIFSCSCTSTSTRTPSSTYLPNSNLIDINHSTPVDEKYFPRCDIGINNDIHQVTYVYKSFIAPGSDRQIELRAYVFFPAENKTAKRHPAIAMFHGGSWSDGYPVTWFPAALYYASRGFVTVSFQYRIQKVHGSTPQESVADAKSAFRWILGNADVLNIDPEKIVVAGDSAGAHIALGISLLDGISDESPSSRLNPRAVIVLYPLVDANLKGFSGISPIETVSGINLPPTLILQGAFDDEPATPPKVSEAFCEKANKLATSSVCHATFFQDSSFFHGFIGARKQYLAMIREMNIFLTKQKLMGSSAANETSMPEACIAPANEPLFKSWVQEYGYSSSTSSLWKH